MNTLRLLALAALVLQDFELINSHKTPEGEKLFESDILLTKEQWKAIRERKAMDIEGSRWTEENGYPLVPYVFADTEVDQAAVKAGIDHWEEHTCIMFEDANNGNTSRPHLQFIKGNGCWSSVGVATPTGQKISIGKWCESLGIVAHEIGHAIGFFHEQSRSDRDDYVVIKYDNIYKANWGNFESSSTNNYGVKYDYGSDMHYGSLEFTKNGKMTIVTKDPFAQELLATRTGLSHRDKLLANKMYGCIDKWVAKCDLSADPCKNEGYIGAKCTCVCPTGVSGTHCETVEADYYEHVRSIHTETITTEKSFTSVGGSKFTKKIVAPSCKKVQLTFDSFNLYKKNRFCYYEYVFIRTGEDLTEGNNYCAQEIAPGQTFTSETNIMILYSYSSEPDMSEGWAANVKFVDDSECSSPSTTSTPTPSTTTIAPTATTPKPIPVVECAKKSKTQNLKPGDAIEIQSSNYPNSYSNGKCVWSIKGDGAKEIVVSCSTFDLEAANKKGKCKFDYLMIGGKKYCGNSIPDVSVRFKRKTKISFKANKNNNGTGFSCTVTAS